MRRWQTQFLKDKEGRIRKDLKTGDLDDAGRAINGRLNGVDVFKESFNAGKKFLEDIDCKDMVARVVRSWPRTIAPSLLYNGSQFPSGDRPAGDSGPRLLPPFTGLK